MSFDFSSIINIDWSSRSNLQFFLIMGIIFLFFVIFVCFIIYQVVVLFTKIYKKIFLKDDLDSMVKGLKNENRPKDIVAEKVRHVMASGMDAPMIKSKHEDVISEKGKHDHKTQKIVIGTSKNHLTNDTQAGIKIPTSHKPGK